MTAEEYKQRTVTLTFPSGLVLDIKPPRVAVLMKIQRTAPSNTNDQVLEMLAQVMQEVGAGFPAGFTLDDLTDPQDWAYLENWGIGFFVKAHPAVTALTQEQSNS